MHHHSRPSPINPPNLEEDIHLLSRIVSIAARHIYQSLLFAPQIEDILEIQEPILL
jgi:hypothetical protein